ncbi:MAG TPA: winged helix-turn-helix domain-containing protein, partial [bacterium]|nr:winged helix-turn-helix domain-containing protein [bacterium]
KRFETDMAEILTLLSRRPCTVDDLADGLQIHRNEALKCVQQLLQGNLIEEIRRDNATYYLPRKP